MDTIDVRPTWSGMLGHYLLVLRDGNAEGRKIATQELYNMAKVADAYVALQDKSKQDEAQQGWTRFNLKTDRELIKKASGFSIGHELEPGKRDVCVWLNKDNFYIYESLDGTFNVEASDNSYTGTFAGCVEFLTEQVN